MMAGTLTASALRATHTGSGSSDCRAGVVLPLGRGESSSSHAYLNSEQGR